MCLVSLIFVGMMHNKILTYWTGDDDISFIRSDKVTILPNKATKEEVLNGYKNVRSQFIDFVNQYNASKTAGTISLNPVELEAMNKLHHLRKTATVDKTKKGGNYFFDMKELHEPLNGKFPKSPSEDAVCSAWNSYNKVHSDLLQVLLMSGATMFQLQL